MSGNLIFVNSLKNNILNSNIFDSSPNPLIQVLLGNNTLVFRSIYKGFKPISSGFQSI